MANYLSQSWRIDRRHALRAMGALISLPLLECMLPLRAAEKMTATPRRTGRQCIRRPYTVPTGSAFMNYCIFRRR